MTATAHDADPLAILDDYDFTLPESSIAQTALAERDAARLLLLDRDSGARVAAERDVRVRDLTAWLRPGDLIVVNATRVLSARLVGRKASGGAAEALLLGPDPERPGAHRALVRCTGRVRAGLELRLGRGAGLAATLEALHGRGEVSLRFAPGVDPYTEGQAPLPPYIRRDGDAETDADLDRYQTVYAREPGAIAAPTAGLHFTPRLLDALSAHGVERAEVVLHVGAGTFRPLDDAAMTSGLLHEETFHLPQETVAAIEATRARGGRVVAVGTTSARVLESRVDDAGRLEAGRGSTRLFLRPGGAPFRAIDALLTNFHLPRSSLLLLVAAFVGREPMLEAYRQAIAEGFRFYSYGDAMLIASGLAATAEATP
ncbi:MAG: tRNA preQ1(34) S-adenosylmethionine ribosyltransferase-isomerase QueA [Myxococcota bacterium]